MRFDITGDKPIWEDGDVVSIRFEHKKKPNEKDGLLLSDSYTYIRKDGYWPGEAEWSSHDDDVMTKAWFDYRAKVMVMIDGPKWPVQVGLDPEGPTIIALRIAERRIANVKDILDKTLVDRPLSSFIDELKAVLG